MPILRRSFRLIEGFAIKHVPPIAAPTRCVGAAIGKETEDRLSLLNENSYGVLRLYSDNDNKYIHTSFASDAVGI